MSNKIKADYQTKDIYKKYKTLYDNPVDEKTFNKFWDILGDKIFNEVIYNASKMVLPGRFRISVREWKASKIKKDLTLSKANKIDWKATKEYHKENPDKRHVVVYHKNTHSRGRQFRYSIDRGNLIKRFHVYRFTVLRRHRRALPYALKNHNVDYYKQI